MTSGRPLEPTVPLTRRRPAPWCETDGPRDRSTNPLGASDVGAAVRGAFDELVVCRSRWQHETMRVRTSRSRAVSRPSGAKPPGRPRNSEIEAGASSRDRLLDAAVELFARNGYDPVTTGAVAEAAGLTQSMVHYHFGSKAKLWEAAIARLMAERGELFPVARLDLSHLEALERLRELVRRLAEANAAQPNYGRIVVQEGMVRGPRLDWLVEHYLAAGYGAFDKAVEDAIAVGAIRPMPVQDVTNALTSAATLAFSLGVAIEQVHGIDMRDPARIRSYVDTLLTILFEGLRPASSGTRAPKTAATLT